REEGIGDVGDDEAEQAAAPGAESAGLRIGEIAELADSVPDALCHFWVHAGDAIDGARDGGDGDVGTIRDGTDIHRDFLARGSAFHVLHRAPVLRATSA